ncbi:response regulator [Oxalobacteraceae bacterium OM1]|nr:response regulator [Oxalobacteraceae bacterium OM1]
MILMGKFVARGRRYTVATGDWNDAGRGAYNEDVSVLVHLMNADSTKADSSPASDLDGAADRSSEKALVVDDQPDVLEVTSEIFRTFGYEVVAVSNGPDALEALRQHPDIDIVFSDVVMPGMDGITLGREIRRLHPGIKIVLASGYAAPALAGKDDALREFTFLRKPYPIPELLKALRRPDKPPNTSH